MFRLLVLLWNQWNVCWMQAYNLWVQIWPKFYNGNICFASLIKRFNSFIHFLIELVTYSLFIRVFWSRARRQVFHRKLRNPGCSLLGMQGCGSFPLLSSLFSIWTDLNRSWKILKDPRVSNMEVGRVDLPNWASGLHRNSPQRLNISSIRVFDQIRHPEIPITVHPECV